MRNLRFARAAGNPLGILIGCEVVVIGAFSIESLVTEDGTACYSCVILFFRLLTMFC
jgi:hypothetical protein